MQRRGLAKEEVLNIVPTKRTMAPTTRSMTNRCNCADNDRPEKCAARRQMCTEFPMSARIGRSNIDGAGLGLFADRDYEQDEFITYYSGQLHFGDEMEGDRVLQFKKGKIRGRSIDAAGSCVHKFGRGDMVNCVLSSPASNCMFKYTGGLPKYTGGLPYLVTKCRVRMNEEFLVEYGPDYDWAQEE